MNSPASELVSALANVPPGQALDLACGSGRHSVWLRDLGWRVTAVDRDPVTLPDVIYVHADLENHEFAIEPAAWDLIVCCLYWQEDLLPEIAAGLKPGGIAALCGKTSGRFATSLANYRSALAALDEIASGEDEFKAHIILRRPLLII